MISDYVGKIYVQDEKIFLETENGNKYPIDIDLSAILAKDALIGENTTERSFEATLQRELAKKQMIRRWKQWKKNGE